MAVLKRAISEKDKLKRREKILKTARTLFEKNDGTLPTISEIAQKAGLSKGSVYLYFKTKNEIFLSLYMHHIRLWHDSLAEAVENFAGDITVAEYSRVLTQYLIRNPLVLRMWSLINVFFTGNIDEKMFMDFKIQLAGLLKDHGKLTYKLFPDLSMDRWLEIHFRIFALILGLWQVYYSPNQMKKLVRESKINIFEHDFSDSVVDSVTTFIKGALQNG